MFQLSNQLLPSSSYIFSIFCSYQLFIHSSDSLSLASFVLPYILHHTILWLLYILLFLLTSCSCILWFPFLLHPSCCLTFFIIPYHGLARKLFIFFFYLTLTCVKNLRHLKHTNVTLVKLLLLMMFYLAIFLYSHLQFVVCPQFGLLKGFLLPLLSSYQVLMTTLVGQFFMT